MSYNEDETLDNLKHWWARFGTPLLLGLAIVLLAFAGWRYWSNSRVEAASAAQKLTQQLFMAQQRLVANGDDKGAGSDLQRIGRQLIDEYAGTPYATDAALVLARRAVESGDLAAAAKQLKWVLDQGPEADTEALVHVRLARVLAAQKQYDAALAELALVDGADLAPMVEEVRGDIALLKGDRAAAKAAYQKADAALAARDEARPVLDLKLADVGLLPSARKSDQTTEAQP